VCCRVGGLGEYDGGGCGDRYLVVGVAVGFRLVQYSTVIYVAEWAVGWRACVIERDDDGFVQYSI